MWSDVRELGKLFGIDPLDRAEDYTLNLYNEWLSSWFEELLNRSIDYKTRTRFYNGTGTQKLLLRDRPVFPNPSGTFSPINIVYDTNGFYGAASGSFIVNNGTATQLIYGTDYTLKIDQDDGGSRSGILIRLNGYWEKPQVRQAGLLTPFIADDTGSYRITTTAGHTVDTLPGSLRMAADMMAARLRYYFPLALELNSEAWDGRNIGTMADAKNYVLSPTIKNILLSHRNWKFG